MELLLEGESDSSSEGEDIIKVAPHLLINHDNVEPE